MQLAFHPTNEKLLHPSLKTSAIFRCLSTILSEHFMHVYILFFYLYNFMHFKIMLEYPLQEALDLAIACFKP